MRCVIVTLSLLALSCAPPPAPEASRALIFGGEPVAEGEHPAVVALAYRKTPAEPWRLECSGALVAPRLVLTAGHCVAPLTGEIAVYAGAGHEGGALPSDAAAADVGGVALHAVERVHAHPHLRAHPLGYSDYGVVVLKDELRGIAPLPLAATLAERRATSALGRELTIVGYGRREDDGTGVKMQVTAAVTRATAQEIVLGGAGRDACTGDSGGPVLARDEHDRWTLAGVVSRGLKLACGEGGYAGIAADALCWLDDSCYGEPTLSALEQVAGGVDLATATKLDLTGAMLDDVSLIPGLAPRVEHLILDGNRLRSVAPLARLSALKTLSIVGNDAVDLDALAPLTARGVVILGTRRQLSTYTQTPFLAACQDASTSESARHTIKAVFFRTMAEDCALANQRLLLLKTFALKDRAITDVTPLAHLQGLETLDLSLNAGLTDVRALAGLESLKKLDLTGTAVTDLSPLQLLVTRGLVVVR